ncbi:MAG: hypothetical protein U1G07_00420 [Verrucomicrobiota bacterium]
MDPHQQTLEALIQRELAKLPERPAPECLIPHVLARIQARRERAWWQRPWAEWPRVMRLASLPLMILGAIGTTLGAVVFYRVLVSSLGLARSSETFETVSAAWDVLSALGNALLLLGRTAGQQWLLWGFVVAFSMYLACVGLGTLCFRVACHSRRPGHE